MHPNRGARPTGTATRRRFCTHIGRQEITVGTTARLAAAGALVVLMAGLGACGSDGDTTQTNAGSEPDGGGGGPCPFDAEEISEATGWQLEETDNVDATGEPAACAFEGGDDAVLVSVFPDGTELADVAAGFEDSAASQYEQLPELGEDAFVAYIETSSTSETDDILYLAYLYLELDDGVVDVSLAGFSNEDDRDAAVDGVVELLAR